MIKEEELLSIYGGASSLSGTFINSLTKLANTLLEIGRTIGSGIKYAVTKKKC